MNPLLLKKLRDRLNGVVVNSINLESDDVTIVKDGTRLSNIRLSTFFDNIKHVSATKGLDLNRVDISRWINDDTQTIRDIKNNGCVDFSNLKGLTIVNVGMYQSKVPSGLKTTISLTTVPDPKQPTKKVEVVAIGFITKR